MLGGRLGPHWHVYGQKVRKITNFFVNRQLRGR